jgi:hypothetical protein
MSPRRRRRASIADETADRRRWSHDKRESWSNPPPISVALSTRRCAGCRGPLASSIVAADPEADYHVCCGPIGPMTVGQMRRAT